MCVAQSFSHVRLFCNPMDYSPPGSFAHGVLQAKILVWVAISSSRGSFLLGVLSVGRVRILSDHDLILTDISNSNPTPQPFDDLDLRLFCKSWALLVCVCAQSCLTLCSPVDCSLPGSSVHGLLHTRILEWVAISSFGGSSRPRDLTGISYISCIGRHVLYH